ncbi:hypothetical protein WR25_10387 [Diploscapter pachys]|uniref:KOW domain-containing protein n=1 Tax=Diploscapter pachys TaxID=2018661 RepID=A0A2A2KRR0_9BILA|nr:hypothetical protein WR25_10387 [Diploscapter pachys]
MKFADDISQTFFFPQTKDQSLWIVKRRMGEEKLPLQIKSVVRKEGLQGVSYIEAYKQTHVQYAIGGISALNSHNIAMVLIKDMVDALRVTKDIPHLGAGSYVRLKRTLYKDDLAQIVDGVKPSLTELEKVQESADDLQKELETATVREKGHSFALADVVEEPLTLNAWELRKFFKAGDHIKILSGDNEGNTGLIVRVEPNLIVVLSNLSMNEMKIRSRDARLCAAVSTGTDSLGRFRFHDLVQRSRARKSKFSIALDRDGNRLSVKDIVKVVDGPYAAKKDNEEMKQGEIKHLYRSFAFVYMRQPTENGGIVVCKPKHLLLVGGSNNKSAPQTIMCPN